MEIDLIRHPPPRNGHSDRSERNEREHDQLDDERIESAEGLRHRASLKAANAGLQQCVCPEARRERCHVGLKFMLVP